MRLLLVEDQADTAEFVLKALREAGHAADCAQDGKEGLFLATTEPYDAIILDRMLPKVDGLTVLRTLRASGIGVPVLILSALGEIDDRVEGLRAGSDDYLVKPFSTIELIARLDAITRRQTPAGEPDSHMLRVADLELNRLSRVVKRGSRVIELQQREYQLLEYLMRHAGQVVTRTMLLESVWDYHFDPGTNVIDVHVSKLRAKIDQAGLPSLLQTVRGAGYRLALADH
ncbi:two-component system OmpR family response regulator [Chitinivorax tropicus]|uniref:Two-component system OmpR family response regulator n=1 Tax=Chitinivorax tropicus TaxID=714531 RepID=A0A840MJK6_9PROT|nr:response regulator transcription factor [Chitinivorax tropicus]MBB5018590.1 two-component system OmpR family response regulator [Chitinivorax tropicus]